MVELEVKVQNVAGDNFAVGLKAPPTPNILPPGWYMLFVLDGSVPSIATWIRVGGDPAGFSSWP
jgi:hypothetical protein